MSRVNRFNKLGLILPKKYQDLTVNCNDELLKQQIKTVLEKVYSKTKDEINEKDLSDLYWDKKDYQAFRKQLGSMTIGTFQRTYSVMLSYLNLSKTELEMELRNIDKILELNTFDDERTLKTTKETIKTETGKEEIKINQEYIYTKHLFTMADLPKFINSLSSKADKFANLLLKEYEENIEEDKSLEEQITDIKTLIDLINIKDQIFILKIEEPYINWINKLSETHPVHICLEEMFTIIIEETKRNLRYKILYLENQKDVSTAHIKENSAYVKQQLIKAKQKHSWYR